MNVKVNAPQISADISAPAVNASTGIPVIRDHMADAVWKEGSTITVNPTLEVDYETGTITASYDETSSVTPIETSGYADEEHGYPVRVKGNTATQLFTQDAATYTPSNVSQIVPAGRFLVGDQTILPVAPPYYDMSVDMAFLGAGVEAVNTSLYSKSDTLKNTNFNGWTPSTTAKTIVASATAGTFSADLANYEYYIIWECGCTPAYTGTPTLKAHTLLTRAYYVQEITKRPSTWANIQANNFNGNAYANTSAGNFLRYYGTTEGTATYSWNVSYGFYFTNTAPTFASSTADTTTVTAKTPTLNTRCSTTYFSTGNAALVDQNNSTWYIRGKVYRTARKGFQRGVYDKLVGLINS